MFISLSASRKDYFKKWTARQILLQYIKEKENITLKDIKELEEQGRVIAGAEEEGLDAILSKRSYHLANFSLVEKINRLREEQLLVLPPEYRIEAGESRNLIKYSENFLVNLDSAEVRKAVLGSKAPAERLNKSQKERFGWEPEKVLGAAFNVLHQNREKEINNKYLGYSWRDNLGHLHIVIAMNAFKGWELRNFQNLAYYQQKWRTDKEILKKELEEGTKLGTQEKLTSKEKQRRERKLRVYASHLKSQRREGHDLQYYVGRLELRKRDLIEPSPTPFRKGRGRNISAPSRSDIYKAYNIKLINIPVVRDNSREASSLVWEIIGKCPCEDKNYSSDRRDTTKEEHYYCPHEIAALIGLKRKYDEEATSWRIPFLPFVIPLEGMIHYVENLRYGTILLEYNALTERFSKRQLNDTEIGRLVMTKIIAEGYDSCFTTDFNKLRKQRCDPLQEIIKFVV